MNIFCSARSAWVRRLRFVSLTFEFIVLSLMPDSPPRVRAILSSRAIIGVCCWKAESYSSRACRASNWSGVALDLSIRAWFLCSSSIYSIYTKKLSVLYMGSKAAYLAFYFSSTSWILSVKTELDFLWKLPGLTFLEPEKWESEADFLIVWGQSAGGTFSLSYFTDCLLSYSFTI